MFKRGFLIAFISVIFLYFILPVIYIDPALWWDTVQNAEGHIQFIARASVSIVISILVAAAVRWRMKADSQWIKGFITGLIISLILLGVVLLIYVMLNIAP